MEVEVVGILAVAEIDMAEFHRTVFHLRRAFAGQKRVVADLRYFVQAFDDAAE